MSDPNRQSKPGRWAALTLLSASLALGTRAFGQPRASALSLEQAVEIAVRSNPNLQIALLQEAQARSAVAAEEAIYDPIFDANAGYTHSRTPSLRGTGTEVGTSDTIDLGAGVSKTFSAGTNLSVGVSGQRSMRSSPPLNAVGTAASVAPAYSVVGQVSLTQPLLRGAGSSIGLAGLRVARLNRTARVLAAQQASSQLLHDVLAAYWELWYASQVVHIDQASRDLARSLESEAREKAKGGLLAEIDALPFATQLAELEEALVVATANRQQRALTLAQSLGSPESLGNEIESVDTPPGTLIDDTEQRAVDEALASSYELKQLDAELRIAQDQASIAGDAQRPRLDLDAYLQAQGLGNAELSPALRQAARLEAVSAHVGVTFETPLSSARRNAQIQSALLSAHIAQKNLEATRQRLRVEVASSVSQRRAAYLRVGLAEQTEKVARAQAEGENARFLAGTTIAIQVQQADDSYRQAQLRVERARVDLALSDLDLSHLRGRLLERYASLLKRANPSILSLVDPAPPP